jgi:uncharacterized protein YndB with AHSA1/START domain
MEARREEEDTALRLTRRYPVAPEKVWRAWIEPQALSAWFGSGEPGSVLLADLDVRPGGKYRIRFRMGGEEHEVGGTYEEVVAPERLAFTWAWHSTPERMSRVVVTLKPVPGGTELQMLHHRFVDAAARSNHERGWTVALSNLERWLSGGSDPADTGRRG